jgi:hypothetical protein
MSTFRRVLALLVLVGSLISLIGVYRASEILREYDGRFGFEIQSSSVTTKRKNNGAEQDDRHNSHISILPEVTPAPQTLIGSTFTSSNKKETTRSPPVTKTPPTSAGHEFKSGIDKNASGVGDLKFETLLECRLAIEKWVNPLIDTWLLDEVPLLDNVITLNGMYHIFLNVKMLSATTAGCRPFLEATWICNHNETAKMLPVGRKSSGVIVLTCNSSSPMSTVWPLAVVSNKTGKTPHYDVRPYLACDELELSMGAPPLPPPQVNIGACVMTKSRHMVEQWIEYHRLIGIHHFWVYINEPLDNLRNLPQRPYVTYVPFNYHWDDHQKNSKYKNYNVWQEALQMQCVYRAKRNKLDWVTTTDIDEYIRVMSPPQHSSTALPPLQHLLDGIPNQDKIGGLILNSVPFGSNQLLKPVNKTNNTLVIDHVWRNKQDLEKYAWARWKMIYKPQNTWDVGIHYLFRGGPQKRLNMTSQAFLQHYKLADRGVFQGSPSTLLMDTELRDQYRDRVLVAMGQTIAKLKEPVGELE